jgi:hypothetical protein
MARVYPGAEFFIERRAAVYVYDHIHNHTVTELLIKLLMITSVSLSLDYALNVFNDIDHREQS